MNTDGMNTDRINEIMEGATDLRSIYDKLTEEELKGMSFETFEKLVYAVPEGDDEELTEEQMEEVAGGLFIVDDFVKWISGLTRKEVKNQAKDIDRHLDDTINDIIGPGM